MEKLSKKTLSLPVLSVNEGEHLGYVKSLVIDPINKEIAAFVINQKGWFKDDKIIPFNRVKNIGDNAIVIDKAGTAEKPANFPQIIKYIKNPAQLINSKVVSTSGKALGHVEEFWFDITGKITKFEISGKITEGLWKGKAVLLSEEVVTIGKDAIMVADGAENRLITGSKHLQKTMNDLKLATSKAWDTTVQTSQKLGHAIASSINKLAEEEKNDEKDQYDLAIPEPPLKEDQPQNLEYNEENEEKNNSSLEESQQKTDEIPCSSEPLEADDQEDTKEAKE